MPPKHEMIRPDLSLSKTKIMVESKIFNLYGDMKRFGIIAPEQANKEREKHIEFIKSSTDPYIIIRWYNEGFLVDVCNDYLRKHKTPPELNKITDDDIKELTERRVRKETQLKSSEETLSKAPEEILKKRANSLLSSYIGNC